PEHALPELDEGLLPAAPAGLGGDLHERGDVTPPQLHVEAGQEGADHHLGVDLAAADGVEHKGLGRVAGDQRAVEVEEGADLRALRPGLDLGQQSVQVVPAHGSGPSSAAVVVRSRAATARRRRLSTRSTTSRSSAANASRPRSTSPGSVPSSGGASSPRPAARARALRNSSREIDSAEWMRCWSRYWRPTPRHASRKAFSSTGPGGWAARRSATTM